MKRGRPRLKLTMPAEQEELRAIFKRSRDATVKERCQALVMPEEGGHTYEQIAGRLCRVRATIQTWVKNFIENGFESLESRQVRNGGRPTETRREDLLEELREGLRDGRWQKASEVRGWLRREHGLKYSYTSIYYWLGKAGGALKVPRPVHVKKDAEEAGALKSTFTASWSRSGSRVSRGFAFGFRMKPGTVCIALHADVGVCGGIGL